MVEVGVEVGLEFQVAQLDWVMAPLPVGYPVGEADSVEVDAVVGFEVGKGWKKEDH